MRQKISPSAKYKRTGKNRVGIMAAPQSKPTSWISELSSGIQALSSLVLMIIAVWAAFFTSLPEALISQLRSEVTEAKTEITELRRTKLRIEDSLRDSENEAAILALEALALKDEQTALTGALEASQVQLEATNSEIRLLTSERTTLSSQIEELEFSRDKLEEELSSLESEREKYAADLIKLAKMKIGAIASFRLQSIAFDIELATSYQLHRNWLTYQKELAEAKRAYDQLSSTELRQGRSNPAFAAYWNLMDSSVEFPEIWLGAPKEPNLDPNVNDQELSRHSVRILNGRWDEDRYQELHNYLINWYFDRIVLERGATEVTPRIFIESLVGDPAVQELLEEERLLIERMLRGYLDGHPEIIDTVMSVIFVSEPNGSQLIAQGEAVEQNFNNFRSTLVEYFARNGIVLQFEEE